MNVKSHHPLTEVIAKKLSGFSTVDNLEQYRMISRAVSDVYLICCAEKKT